MMEKTLAAMPDHIRASAWCNSHRWYARLVMWIWEKLYFLVGMTSAFSWWTVAYWVLYANLPFDSVTEGIPKTRNFIVWTFAANFVAILAVHWLELLTMIPRADKEYPLVDNGCTHQSFAGSPWDCLGDIWYGMALPATVFGALLLLASYMQSHGSHSHADHLGYGIGMVGLGTLAFYCNWRPPKLGLNVPSESEVNSAYYARLAEHERQMQPRSAPAEQQTAEDYATPVSAKQAKLDFSGIFGMQAVKDKLLEPACQVIADRQPGHEAPANGILLHGEPGNGKTVFAEALAGELGVPFIQLTYGDVSSKWLGEMPRVIANCFAYAKRHAPCVLFIDEIDSFITSRDSASSNSEDLKVTNTLLTEIVNLREHKVVLMGAQLPCQP